MEKKIITVKDIEQEMANEMALTSLELKSMMKELNAEKAAFKKEHDKGARLRKLGFTSTKDVINLEEPEQNINYLKHKVSSFSDNERIINKYKKLYPNHKFVPEEIFVNVCQKYGIVGANVEHFVGDVPEKNLQEIENFMTSYEKLPLFKLKRTITIREWDFESGLGYSMHRYSRTKRTTNIIIEGTKAQCKNKKPNYIMQDEQYSIQSNSIKIAAPLSQFSFPQGEDVNIKDFQVVESKTVVSDWEVYDPIVYVNLPEGKLIISAWDIEASDPAIINEKMN